MPVSEWNEPQVSNAVPICSDWQEVENQVIRDSGLKVYADWKACEDFRLRQILSLEFVRNVSAVHLQKRNLSP